MPREPGVLTTIILISLGIILAAAAAMMTIHYGGDVMTSGSVKAQAATLDNAAQNVRAAVAGRRFAGVRSNPKSISELSSSSKGAGWLESMPDVTQAGGGAAFVGDVDGRNVYGVPGIPEDVCAQVNLDYRGAAGIPSLMPQSGKGCILRSDGSYLFFVIIGDAT